jgi:hypothetical protein
MFDRVAPIFPVHDVAAALEFYARLGFDVRTYVGGGLWLRLARWSRNPPRASRRQRSPSGRGVPSPPSTPIRVGLGESARFLGRHGTCVGRLMLPRAYRSERLLERLRPHLADPDNRVAELHLFTFNEIERAEPWRYETIAR